MPCRRFDWPTCPVCGGHCLEAQCQHAVSFVADVAVTEVIASARDLLKQASERRRPSAPAIREDFACGEKAIP